jgi:hypothetical protein
MDVAVRSEEEEEREREVERLIQIQIHKQTASNQASLVFLFKLAVYIPISTT